MMIPLLVDSRCATGIWLGLVSMFIFQSCEFRINDEMPRARRLSESLQIPQISASTLGGEILYELRTAAEIVPQMQSANVALCSAPIQCQVFAQLPNGVTLVRGSVSGSKANDITYVDIHSSDTKIGLRKFAVRGGAPNGLELFMAAYAADGTLIHWLWSIPPGKTAMSDGLEMHRSDSPPASVFAVQPGEAPKFQIKVDSGIIASAYQLVDGFLFFGWCSDKVTLDAQTLFAHMPSGGLEPDQSVFFVKVGFDGNLIWKRMIGPVQFGSEGDYFLAITGNEDILSTVSTKKGFKLQAGNANSTDPYINRGTIAILLTPDGNLKWARTLGLGLGAIDFAHLISPNELYVTGRALIDFTCRDSNGKRLEFADGDAFTLMFNLAR